MIITGVDKCVILSLKTSNILSHGGVRKKKGLSCRYKTRARIYASKQRYVLMYEIIKYIHIIDVRYIMRPLMSIHLQVKTSFKRCAEFFFSFFFFSSLILRRRGNIISRELVPLNYILCTLRRWRA